MTRGRSGSVQQSRPGADLFVSFTTFQLPTSLVRQLSRGVETYYTNLFSAPGAARSGKT